MKEPAHGGAARPSYWLSRARSGAWRWARRRALVVALALAAIGGWALWRWPPCCVRFFTAWMPNVGTAFAIIAFTIAAVEVILMKQRQELKRPAVASILRQIRVALLDFAEEAELDYLRTHFKDCEPPPSGRAQSIPGLLAHWRNGLKPADKPRERPDGVPAIIRAATVLSAKLDELIQRYANQLYDADLDLTALSDAMRQFVKSAGVVNSYVPDLEKHRDAWGDERACDLVAELAEPACALADVYARTEPRFAVLPAGYLRLPRLEGRLRAARRAEIAMLMLRCEHEDERIAEELEEADRRVAEAKEAYDRSVAQGLSADQQAAAADLLSEAKQTRDLGRALLGWGSDKDSLDAIERADQAHCSRLAQALAGDAAWAAAVGESADSWRARVLMRHPAERLAEIEEELRTASVWPWP